MFEWVLIIILMLISIIKSITLDLINKKMKKLEEKINLTNNIIEEMEHKRVLEEVTNKNDIEKIWSALEMLDRDKINK